MTKILKKLASDRSGATAIEYGLIAGFIALAMVAALPNIQTGVKEKFDGVAKGLGHEVAQEKAD
ncbi:Flp family type IVb pilin [Phenylobacterium sp.]|uniref:Flp family type IVb pilin n=1 Tax=Phenylobacterium sp. TaxID=1871053 RepID=UPI0035B2F878